MTERANSKSTREQSWGARLRAKAYYPVAYMFVVTFFFTTILVGLARATRARVEANRQIMFERAVLLAVLPDDVTETTPSPVVHEMFAREIESPDDFSGGAYRLVRSGELMGYALPIEGQGFWDVIRGVIGIRPDGETLIGIGFYQQKETPGLGAEMTKPYFRRRFADRRMASGDRAIGLAPVGAEVGENEVHAITGATQTSTRLETIINRAVENWRERTDSDKGGRE